MLLAQFHHKSATSGKVIPACGSDSVLIIDGRKTIQGQDLARSHGRTLNERLGKGYVGFTLHKGRTFREALDSPPCLAIQEL